MLAIQSEGLKIIPRASVPRQTCFFIRIRKNSDRKLQRNALNDQSIKTNKNSFPALPFFGKIHK